MDDNIPLDLGSPVDGRGGEAGEDSGGTENSFDLASWKRVFRHAYSLVGNEAEAEDLTQESSLPKWADTAIGGWQASGAYQAQSGTPVDFGKVAYIF